MGRIEYLKEHYNDLSFIQHPPMWRIQVIKDELTVLLRHKLYYSQLLG
jgi:hypothetical protein